MINTKVILVTGGSSGIGYEAAQRLVSFDSFHLVIR